MKRLLKRLLFIITFRKCSSRCILEEIERIEKKKSEKNINYNNDQ